MQLNYREIPSSIGSLFIVCDSKSIKAVCFTKEELRSRYKTAERKDTPITVKAAKQLAEYFKGARKTFDLPVDPDGTEFQRKAWKSLMTIPYGETISYFEQACRIGNKKAVRAVGGANGRNPIPIIIPCHRVIGKNGSLTGYGGGMSKKEKLLSMEGH